MENDIISRQAAIRWVKTECNPYGKPTLDFESGKKVIEHLEQMPSAQPEQRWMPCSERLPKVRQWVLCQCRAGIIDVLRLTDDGCWYRKSNEIYMSGFVLAWMPLPEPYEETTKLEDVDANQEEGS